VGEKLDEVGAAIKKLVMESGGLSLSFPGKTGPEVETDFEFLSILEKYNLIPDSTEPLIIWGENNFILDFLKARILEKKTVKLKVGTEFSKNTGKPEGGHFEERPVSEALSVFFKEGRGPHPMQILEGLSLNYMNEVYSIFNPTFNVQTLGGVTMHSDNAHSSSDLMNKFKKDVNKTNTNRPIPLFLLGVPNSNILAFDVDSDFSYGAILQNVRPEKNSAAGAVATVIPPGFGREFKEMYYLWSNGKLNKRFRELCESFISQPVNGEFSFNNFEEWGTLFNDQMVPDDFYHNLRDAKFTIDNHTDYDAEFQKTKYQEGQGYPEERNPDRWLRSDMELVTYYNFMWEAFSKLFESYDEGLRSIKEYDGKTPQEAAMTFTMEATEKLASIGLSAKVKTLPMFHLSTDDSIMLRPCIVYCKETQFAGTEGYSDKVSWYSGMYRLFGFSHTISQSSAHSEFMLSRPPSEIASKDEETDALSQQEAFAANFAKLIGDPGPLPGG
jgi:hypothetical protein